MTKYRKVAMVEACRFLPRPETVVGNLWNDWIVSRNSVSGVFFIAVDKSQIANVGDWIIKEPDDSWRVMSHELFTVAYELSSEEIPRSILFIGVETVRDETAVALVTREKDDAMLWLETPCVGARKVEVWDIAKRGGNLVETLDSAVAELENENLIYERHDPRFRAPVRRPFRMTDMDKWKRG